MNIKRMNRGEAADKNINRIFLLLFIAATLYPILFVGLTALKSTNEFYTNIWKFPQHVAWSNFLTAWKTAHIGEYFLNSVIVVVITVVVTLILAALAGYALARMRVPYADTIMFVILACTMLPSESMIMPMYIITSKLKMTGTYESLIVPYIGWGLPLTIYIYRNFFKTIPNELLEAARIDGCTEIRSFYKISIPLMLPATATNAIFLFVGWWGELLWASIALSTTNMRTIPMGIITFSAKYGTDWGPLSAAIIIIMLPLIVFFLFTQKYFVQGLSGGGVKG